MKVRVLGFSIPVMMIAILIALFSIGQSVPQLINYQGRLTNPAGQPLDGVTVHLAFTFYSLQSGGTTYLTVLQNNVSVSKGIYNVLIGSGAVTAGAESTLADVFQKHGNVWMGVKVNADPEMTPRARISSVGYAFQADNVNTAWLTAFMSSDDYDGDGYIKGIDCDDGNASVNPGAVEICNDGIDNDCDGFIDSQDLDCQLLWTWISGSTIRDQFGAYGTKGTPDPANVPGARDAAVSWTDTSGKLWLFGGFGHATSASYAYINDLWRWDGTNWTWISGSNDLNQHGVYGTKGTPDPANVPGARVGAVSWTDTSGKLWLFGGAGLDASSAGYLNDLWRWDGANWTWISGSNSAEQYGVYGTKGTPAPANVPGARYEAVSWIDTSGNLWLFGGEGYAASGSSGLLNDLWRWDGANWTWISGSNSINQHGVYGTKGTPDPANVPGARYEAVSWTDTSGKFWLFGGEGYAASGSSGRLNDLWRWDGANWTWISGNNVVNQNGIYGTKGTPDPANVPGARYDAVSWTDASGKLWLFGGVGNAASGVGYLNDLWRWDGANWTWISGSNSINQHGVYGTKGTPDPANVPGARYNAVSWTDTSGKLWLLGGDGYPASGGEGLLNDLWRYRY